MSNSLILIKDLKNKKKTINKEIYRYLYDLTKKTILLYLSNNKTECIYTIPYIILGYPKYNINKVSKYIIKKIKKHNILIIFIKPNYLYINWFNI
tara:strand:- start:947 stop:1231 length:285 start_codon:yes stop_codon:yes gene_type:complete